MQSYDLLMLIVLAFATVFGFWKGLAWQVASLSSIFISYFVAVNFRAPVAKAIHTDPPWNAFLAMLILFLATSLAIWIAFRTVSKAIERFRLKEFDSHAGAVLGFTRGVIWCVIITLFAVTLLSEAKRQAIVDSRSGYCIALLLDRSHAIMPEEIHEVLAPYIHSLDERLPADERRSHWQGEPAWSEAQAPSPAAGSGGGLLPASVGQQVRDESEQAIQRWLQSLPQEP
jgi:membrane protein required for colicin V production